MLKLYIAGDIGAQNSEAILVDPVKVSAGLTTGNLEILDNHTELLGPISNNIVEYTFLKDNKPETKTYFFRTGIFWIGNKNIVNLKELLLCTYDSLLRPKPKPGVTLEAINGTGKKFDTTVVVYGKGMFELRADIIEEPLLKAVEKAKELLDQEIENVKKLEKLQKPDVNGKIPPLTVYQLAKKEMLQEDFYSSQQLILFVKEYKKRGK